MIYGTQLWNKSNLELHSKIQIFLIIIKPFQNKMNLKEMGLLLVYIQINIITQMVSFFNLLFITLKIYIIFYKILIILYKNL